MADKIIQLNTGTYSQKITANNITPAINSISLDGIADKLRQTYLHSTPAKTEAVHKYETFLESLCKAAADKIKSNIAENKDPIFIYNPMETNTGIILSKADLNNFNDPAFYMVMKEYADKTGFNIETKVIPVKMPLSPITNINGNHPEVQAKQAAVPVIIISI